mmetsp:Transcript_818/g.1970  ORF Transcript_818/g.1970 Transcript_818/m.1970 type:complete len:352 (+) Transcript_818:323-1378(+)
MMGIMPWLAVPLHRRPIHKKLTRRFQVRQIPMLVLLDSNGKTVHRDITPAVTHIVEDADGDTFADQFPWTEKRYTNIKQMLGESFLKGDGSSVSLKELDGKYIGVLFSANWHWHCRRFQQLLEYMYEKLKSEGQPFEVVDMDFSAEMRWLAMPESSYELKQKLGEAFRVEQCPMLIIIDPEGNVVTTEGVEIVNKDSEGECFPWTPKPLYDLFTLEPEILGEMNETVTCVILCEGCDKDTKALVQEQMLPIATEYFDEAKASGCEAGILFFVATETNDVVHQLRVSCEIGEASNTPQMVLLDIPDAGAFYVYDGQSITTDDIRGFLQAYDEEQLERRELQEDEEDAQQDSK